MTDKQNGFAPRALSAARAVSDTRAFTTTLAGFYAADLVGTEILMAAELFKTPSLSKSETPIMRTSRAYDCWLHVVNMRTEKSEVVAWACHQSLDDSEMEDLRLLERLLIPTVFELDGKQFVHAVVTAVNEYRHGLLATHFPSSSRP